MLSLSERLLHKTLRKLSKRYEPISYLEIGVREGDSLRAVLKGHHPSRIVLCDTWKDFYGGTNRGSGHHIERLLKDLKYKGFLTIFSESSHTAIPKIRDTFDMITVDGDHTYNGALTDLRTCWSILNTDGILVFDDVIHKSHKYLKDCIENFIREVSDECVILEKNYKDDNGIVVLMKNA